jgi:hypothetical protein
MPATTTEPLWDPLAGDLGLASQPSRAETIALLDFYRRELAAALARIALHPDDQWEADIADLLLGMVDYLAARLAKLLAGPPRDAALATADSDRPDEVERDPSPPTGVVWPILTHAPPNHLAPPEPRSAPAA